MSKKFLKNAGTIFLVSLAYFVTAKLGLRLASVHPSATAVWAPTGISIASFLLFGRRVWPGIFLGAFFSNVTTAGTIFTSLGIAAGNTLEGLVGAFLINKFAEGRRAFERPITVLRFVIFGGLLATTVSATIGVLSLVLGGAAAPEDFSAIWITWWLGDVAGALIFTPFFVLWGNEPKIPWKSTFRVESILINGVIALTILAAIKNPLFNLQEYPIELLYPFLIIWTAFRFSGKETAIMTAIISVVAVWHTLQGFGPFHRPSPNESLLLLQVFTGAFAVVGMSVSAIVSERRRATERLRESEEKYHAVFTSGSLGINLVDPATFKFIEANEAFANMTGYTKEELTNLTFNDITHPDDVQVGVDLVKRMTRGEVPSIRIEKRYITKDKRTVWANLFASLIRDDVGSPLYEIAIIEDITERKELDRTKSEFISLASHQLRTPITAINWSAERLLSGKESGSLTEKQRTYVISISDLGKRMAELVGQLLDLSRIELGTLIPKIEKIDPRAVAEDVFKELAPLSKKKKLVIHKEYDAKLKTVSADPHLLRIIFQNLLSNSMIYTPEGGKISLVLKRENPEEVYISVSDTGYGIPREEQRKVFASLFRAENAKKLYAGGTGLGLYLVKSILNQCGGRVWFDSEEGKGSTFYVTLPEGGAMRQNK